MSALRLVALLFVLTAPALHADWRLDSSSEVASAGGVRHVVKEVSSGDTRLTVHLAFFETPHHTLRVIDRAGMTTVKDAVVSADCIAGVNGGFFERDDSPIGLVVSGGKQIHPLQSAKLLSGVIAATADRVFVLRRSEFKLGPRTRDAIQSGPFLVDNGKPVAGLGGTRRARRTIILTDGHSRHALAVCGYSTLAEAAAILAAPNVISELKLRRALNLDGGTSTGLYFGGEKPFYLPNVKRVRNCLGIAAAR